MRLHISQTTLLVDKYILINLSLRVSTASAMSVTPHIVIHSAAISEVFTLKNFLTRHDNIIQGFKLARTNWAGI